MRLRLISAIILIPLALGSVLLSAWTTLAFWGIAMLLAAFEYYQMTRKGGYQPLWIPLLLLIGGLYLEAFWQLNLMLPILVVALALPPLWELTRRDHGGFLL